MSLGYVHVGVTDLGCHPACLSVDVVRGDQVETVAELVDHCDGRVSANCHACSTCLTSVTAVPQDDEWHRLLGRLVAHVQRDEHRGTEGLAEGWRW